MPQLPPDRRGRVSPLKGTSVEGTSVEGTSVEGTSVEGTSVEGTGSPSQTAHDAPNNRERRRRKPSHYGRRHTDRRQLNAPLLAFIVIYPIILLLSIWWAVS